MPATYDRTFVADCALQLRIIAEALRVFGGAGYYPGLNGKGKELIAFGDRINPIASEMQDFASELMKVSMPSEPSKTRD